MYDPKYDLPLAVGFSLTVSVIATYVTADNSVNPQGFDEGTLSSPPEVVDCELDDGTSTTCYQIMTAGVPAHQNSCVQCSLDYVDGGITETYLIPVTPTPADTTGAIGTKTGLSLNGV